MPDKVTISHRGAKYEIGRGKRYYAIWVTGAPEDAPVDRWPETPEGWAQAWARFTAIETPGTITTVERPGFTFPRLRLGRRKAAEDPGAEADGPRRTAPARTVAIALLAGGVILGVAGLFPNYFGGGQSLAGQAAQIVPHLLFLVGWLAAAVLLTTSGRSRIGALLGTGLSAVTLGLFWSDLGYVASGQNALGAGLVLGTVGWVLCAAGSAAGFAVRPAASTEPLGGPWRPQARHAGPIALLGLGAIGTAVTFAPAWDSYTLTSPGGSQTITAGNAFALPGVIITGNVLVMVALIAVAVTAALWRPARHGAVLLAGAIVPMAAQAISALIQVSEPTSPSQFGISQSQASAAGLAITNGVTPVFWVYCVFVIALVISCAWLFTEPAQPASPASVLSTPASPIEPDADDDDDATATSAADVASGDSATSGGGSDPEGDTESSFA